MSIAVFGSKVFEVTQDKTYTFDDFQYGTGLETEKQDASGKKPSTYNKGPGLNTLSFKVMLDASMGVNPRTEIESWEAIKDVGIAYPFVLGKRPLGPNKWLLVDVQTSDVKIDSFGNILSAMLMLKFDEYVRAGSASKSSSKTSAPGISIPPVSGNVTILNPSEKSQLKRENKSLEV